MAVKNLKFHIQNDDYFGTLATVLDLIKQRLDDDYGHEIKSLENVVKDLMYLQGKYKIVKKG
jgi:hypothetical protein